MSLRNVVYSASSTHCFGLSCNSGNPPPPAGSPPWRRGFPCRLLSLPHPFRLHRPHTNRSHRQGGQTMAHLIRKPASLVLVLFLLAPLLFTTGRTTAAEDKVVVIPLSDTVKGVPKTGQTKCYALNESLGYIVEVSCAGTGQDGELQKGITWPAPRFTDNKNGTVTDNLTRLVWLQNANCLGGTKTRAQALQFAQILYDGFSFPGTLSGDCGLSDGSTAGQWRVPNRFEMESLLDLSQFHPALPLGHPFIKVQNNYYWTSSYLAWGESTSLGVGWAVVMGSGLVFPRSWELEPCFVWLVRDGS